MAEGRGRFSYVEREFDRCSERYGGDRKTPPVTEQNFRRRRHFRTRRVPDGNGQLEYRRRRGGLSERFDGLPRSRCRRCWTTCLGKGGTIDDAAVLFRLEEIERCIAVYAGTLITPGIRRFTRFHPDTRYG